MNCHGVVYKVYGCCTLCLGKKKHFELHIKVVPPHNMQIIKILLNGVVKLGEVCEAPLFIFVIVHVL
jgi:hypothetical protein